MSSWRASARTRVGVLDLDVEMEGDDAPLALVGPNGSGKTTFLRVLTGAHPPTEAEIVVGGEVLVSTGRGVDLPIERRRVGYVPQGFGLFPHLRVVDNVGFGLSSGPRRRGRKDRRGAARAALEELGYGHLADRMPGDLSGGEQQAVALTRALVIEPALLLLDEPLSALDATARKSVRAFLGERLRQLGRPSIVVTHDSRDVEALGARVWVLEGGRIVQSGDLDDLRAAPATDFVAEFAGAMSVGAALAAPSGPVHTPTRHPHSTTSPDRTP